MISSPSSKFHVTPSRPPLSLTRGSFPHEASKLLTGLKEDDIEPDIKEEKPSVPSLFQNRFIFI